MVATNEAPTKGIFVPLTLALAAALGWPEGLHGHVTLATAAAQTC